MFFEPLFVIRIFAIRIRQVDTFAICHSNTNLLEVLIDFYGLICSGIVVCDLKRILQITNFSIVTY